MRTPVVLLVAGLFAFNAASSLKICAFNVQSFGEAKVNNKKVVGILLKVLNRKCWTKWAASKANKRIHGCFSSPARQILSRCDLCLLQEVRDSKGEAVQALVKDLNRYKLSWILKTPSRENRSRPTPLYVAVNRFDRANTYSYVESERLGKKTYKEQYVYIYR